MRHLPMGLRLLLGFIAIAVLPLAGLAGLYLSHFERALTETVLQNLSSIANKKADQIDTFIVERIADARTYAQRPRVRQTLIDAARTRPRPEAAAISEKGTLVYKEMLSLFESSKYYDLLLIDAAGNVVFSILREPDLGTNLLTGPYRDTGLAQGFRQAMQTLSADLTTPFRPYAPSNDKYAGFIVAPVMGDDGRLLGALALQINIDFLTEVVVDHTGLGMTGEAAVAHRIGDDVLFTVPMRRAPDAAFRLRIPMAKAPPPMRQALSGERGYGITTDYTGIEVVAAWRYLPALGWGMVAKIDADEAFAPVRNARRFAIIALGLFLLISAVATALLGHRFARADRALRQSRDQLNEAQRIAGVGSWCLDLRTHRLEWSDEIYRIFAIDPTKFGADYEAFLAAIHPEDREAVNKIYTDSVLNRKPYEITHRLLFPDGRIKYVHEHCETLYDPADGRPLLSRGTVQDVTEAKQTEQTLRLYANIFERSGEAILVTDWDNRIVAVNHAFTQLTGYSFEEVRDENPRVLASDRTPRETYQTMWAALNESGFWQGELWDRRKDGRIYPKWAAISVIRDDLGNTSHHIASFTDISDRKAAEERIHRLAHHDVLTGLFNRFSLEDRLEQALLTAQREHRQLAVLFIDMDRFKVINDTLGHHVGDALLLEVSRRLQASVRESDIVARLGGDEFVVALTGMESGMSTAASTASKILRMLGEPYHIEGNELHSSPSIGVSIFPVDGDNTELLMKNADTAMYHAKSQGRNNCQFYTAEMNLAASERMHMERDLRTALAERQFELHYQPQVHTTDGRACGVEALVRWHHPEHGLVAPMKFIPVAEEMGLIGAIGAWVLDEACRQMAEWKSQGIRDIRMAVNLSAHQLHSPELVQEVRETMDRHGIVEGDLELEVTESAAMADPERAISQLKALRDAGVDLAIDDFGTGYSSLAYLKLLPIQTLKLDRAFVRDIETDENDAAISAATLALARNLNLKVVAEGVETPGQRDFLAAHRCDFLQGYLFSKPLPAAAALAYLRNQSPQ